MPTSPNRALIVGCGDIALAAARLIGQRHPLLLIDVDQAAVDRGCEAMRADGCAVEGLCIDITDAASVGHLAAHIRGGGPLGVIAHVAALAPSAGDWRKIMAVDLIGPHLIAREIGPLIVDGGVAVFVSSVAGYLVDPDAALHAVLADPLVPDYFERLEATVPSAMTPSLGYEYSKSALHLFAERLATEWGPRGVRALTVSPGLIQSAMGRRERAHNPSTGSAAAFTPLQREGTVAEAAVVIDFATWDAASFLNGVDLLVDGGLRASRRTAQREGGAMPIRAFR